MGSGFPVPKDGNERDDGKPDGNVGRLSYFENVRSATVPVFVQRFHGDNPFFKVWSIDVEDRSVPALVDLDGDGTLRPCPSIDKLRRHVSCSRRRPRSRPRRF